MTVANQTEEPARPSVNATVFPVLFAISFAHLLNDTIQSLLPALYPVLKESFALTFAQIGLISLAFQVTGSFLQPVVGLLADRRPMPYSLTVGMAFTCAGVLLLAGAPNYLILLVAAAFIGLGSAIFHPESSRVAWMAAGQRRGLAQSLFQVGGNAGTAVGPLLAAFVIIVTGQSGIAWFTVIPLLGMIVLWRVGGWYRNHPRRQPAKRPRDTKDVLPRYSTFKVIAATTILLALIFSKQIYTASMSNYYTFYLIETFGVAVPTAQVFLFFFLLSIAFGTLIGGWLSDRFGRKTVILFSVLGALPFTLALPYAGLFWAAILTLLIGMIMASSVSVVVVFAQDLFPGRVGMISGLFIGFAFGMGGLGAALLGELADATSLDFVFQVCSYLPALGLLAVFLPDVEKQQRTLQAKPAIR